MPDGTERRVMVSPGTDRLQLSNVPSTLLPQVIAQLYARQRTDSGPRASTYFVRRDG